MQINKFKILVNTSYNFLGKLLPLAVAVFAMPILIHKLGTDRFGILTLCWAVIGYFSIFNLGIGAATTKFVAEYQARNQTEELPELIWSSVLLLFGFGVLAGLIGWSLSSWLVERVLNIEPSLWEESRQSLCLLMASLPFFFATNGMQGVLAAQHRFGVLNIINAPLALVNYLVPLLILAYTVNLVPIVGSLALARLVVCGISFGAMRQTLPGLTRPSWPKARNIKMLLSFGGWLTVSSIIGPLMVNMDRFLIGSVLTMSAVAYYVTPYELVSRFLIIPGSLTPVLFPTFSAFAVEDQDKCGVLLNRSVKFLFLIMVPGIIAIIVMARPILELWLGQEFASRSTLVLQVLALGVLINCLAQVPFGAIQATGRPDLTAKCHMAEFLVYFLSLWLLIKPMGIVGVALAWTTRISLDMALLFWLFRRLFPQKTPLLAAHKKWGGSMGLLGLLAAVSALAQLPSLGAKIIFLPIIIVLFLILFWRSLLDDAERAEAFVLINRFRRLIMQKGDLHA